MESEGVPAKAGFLGSIWNKKAKVNSLFTFISESATSAAWGLKSFVTYRSEKPGEAHSRVNTQVENSIEKKVVDRVAPEEKVMVPVALEEGERVVSQVLTEEVPVAPKEGEKVVVPMTCEGERVMAHVASKEAENVVVSVAAEEGEKVVVLVAPKEGERVAVPMILEEGEKLVVLVAFKEEEKVMVQADPKEGEGVVVPMTLEKGEKVVTPVVAKEGEKVVFPVAAKETNEMVVMVAVEEAGKVMVQVGPKEEEGEMVPMALDEGEKMVAKEGEKVVALVTAKEGEKVVVPMEAKEGDKVVVLVALKEGERVVVPMSLEKQEKVMIQVVAAKEGEKAVFLVAPKEGGRGRVVVLMAEEGEKKKGVVHEVAPVPEKESILVRVRRKMDAASTWAKAKLKSVLKLFSESISDTVLLLRSIVISCSEKLRQVLPEINTQLDNLSEKKSVEVQGVPKEDSLLHAMKMLIQKVRKLVKQHFSGPGSSREMKFLVLKLMRSLDWVDGFIELLEYHKQPARFIFFLLLNGFLIYRNMNPAGGVGIAPEHEDKASMALGTLATLVFSSSRLGYG